MARVFDRFLLDTLYRGIGKPPVRISLWNGLDIGPENNETLIAHVSIRDRGIFYRLFTNPDMYFGEGYSSGRIQVNGNLVQFLDTIYRHMRNADRNWLARAITHWQARPRRNSLNGSKNNIYKHYDIGNDFYNLWLDEAMQYTCAYYPSPDAALEDAQTAKMDHIARKLQLRAGETVVEAGCGWGALGLHLAKNYGVKVKAYNISHQQILYARERAASEGMQDMIEYIEDDYRNIKGKFDVFVSVGMLEHVGVDNYKELGDVINGCLKADGRGLIHSIARNRPVRMNAWIERNIFPGAYPPTMRECMDIFEDNNFSLLDVENIRLHYAQTLMHWLERFEKHSDDIARNFDEAFLRAWRLYLAGSVAAFSSGALQLFQIVFAPGESNQVPWTRDHIYKDSHASYEDAEEVWKRAMSS